VSLIISSVNCSIHSPSSVTTGKRIHHTSLCLLCNQHSFVVSGSWLLIPTIRNQVFCSTRTRTSNGSPTMRRKVRFGYSWCRRTILYPCNSLLTPRGQPCSGRLSHNSYSLCQWRARSAEVGRAGSAQSNTSLVPSRYYEVDWIQAGLCRRRMRCLYRYVIQKGSRSRG
jgi:hypothetical protein